MNQLLKGNQYKNAITKMQLHFAEIVLAKVEGRKFGEIPHQEAVNIVTTLIIKCIRTIGHYNDANDEGIITFLVSGLISEIIKNRKHLTDKELELILNKGAIGDYRQKPDEFVACNLLSINTWIDSYAMSNERKMAMTEYNKLLAQIPVKKEPTGTEKIEIIKKGCINAYREYLNTGNMPYAVSHIYYYLKESKNIKWSDVEKEEMIKEANINYKIKLKKENPFHAKESIDGLTVEKIRVALRKYFEKLKSNGENELSF